MRPPSDMPPPRRVPTRRRRMSNRTRTLLIVLGLGLFVLITSLRGIAGFYTDYLWFESLGYEGVWTGVLGARIILGLLFTVLFFVLMWLNLYIADRLAPRFRPRGPEDEMIERYHEVIAGRTGLVRLGVSALFALIAGAGVSAQWNDWILFTNRVDFGVKDPQFDMDAGFYVFQLPFLTFVTDWAFAALIIVIIVTTVAHYLNGGIRVQTPASERVTPQVKAHLSVLLGVLALIRTGGYVLDRYELNFSTRGFVDGAGYTDVNAQLPAITLLLLISLAAAALFIANIFRRGWVLPVLAVGVWGIVSVIAGTIYPTFIQNVRVNPNESEREAPYIERNLEATQYALALDESRVTVHEYPADGEITAADLETNRATIENVRLLDPLIVNDTFERLQQVRDVYRFVDLDVDRYEIDGRLTQVVVAARELDEADIPQQSWEGRHLAFTHGYGVAMAPANRINEDGQPVFMIRDLPPRAPDELVVDKPGVYFGEGLGSYAIVNTGRPEVDYIDATNQVVETRYDGADGVGVGSLLRKAAFALRFGDVNPLISGFITGESRIIYMRDVRDRVETLAPFLHFDADPYPVLVDGKMLWLIDGYTTTSRYPYAQRVNNGGLTAGSGLGHNFNYIRNSVKATVDAYDGTVTFYVVDDEDPIIRAYRKAFPNLFTDWDEAPADLGDHLRYPEDLFRVQTNMWGRYHIEGADNFYSQADQWAVAQDPGSGVVSQTQTTTEQGVVVTAPSGSMDPYYLLTRLPGEETEEFVLMRLFVPSSNNQRRPNLSAFMSARGGPDDDFGRIDVYRIPPDRTVFGPLNVLETTNSNAEFSELQTLLGSTGSTLLQGNLQLVPIEDSLLYIRPIYVQANASGGGRSDAAPELEKVVVVLEGRVAVEDSLDAALDELFGATGEDDGEEPGPSPDDGEDDGPTPGGEVTGEVSELLERASQAFGEADAALQRGDLAAYQQKVNEARFLLEQARAQAGEAEPAAPPDEEPADGGDGEDTPTTTTSTVPSETA